MKNWLLPVLFVAIAVGSACGQSGDADRIATGESSMDSVLRELLETLETVGRNHEEVYDTHVREQMWLAISQGFISPVDGYFLPEKFGMFSAEGDNAVRDALASFLTQDPRTAEALGLYTPTERLAAFQNPAVTTRRDKRAYDWFFGHTDEP